MNTFQLERKKHLQEAINTFLSLDGGEKRNDQRNYQRTFANISSEKSDGGSQRNKLSQIAATPEGRE